MFAVRTSFGVYSGGLISFRRGVVQSKMHVCGSAIEMVAAAVLHMFKAPVHVALSSLRLSRRVESGGLSIVLEISNSLHEAK